jgi:hypothetical protein
MMLPIGFHCVGMWILAVPSIRSNIVDQSTKCILNSDLPKMQLAPDLPEGYYCVGRGAVHTINLSDTGLKFWIVAMFVTADLSCICILRNYVGDLCLCHISCTRFRWLHSYHLERVFTRPPCRMLRVTKLLRLTQVAFFSPKSLSSIIWGSNGRRRWRHSHVIS